MVPFSRHTHTHNDYTQLPTVPHTSLVLYPWILLAATERHRATQRGFYFN